MGTITTTTGVGKKGGTDVAVMPGESEREPRQEKKKRFRRKSNKKQRRIRQRQGIGQEESGGGLRRKHQRVSPIREGDPDGSKKGEN